MIYSKMKKIKTFPKPIRKEKTAKWGVKRKNPKPKKFKKNLPKRERPMWRGDPLLEPYYPGIAKIPPELYDKVKQRSNNICEICGKRKSEEVHHLAGRRRKACLQNLLDTCKICHKPPTGIHANKEIYEREMKKLQDVYFSMGFNEERVRWLLGTKSNRLF